MQKTYKLARKSVFRSAMDSTFGPMMTLAKAQAYQADMNLGGFDVMVVNVATDQDFHMTQRKGWKESALLTL